MYILVESYPYNTNELNKILEPKYITPLNNNKSICDYVGYFKKVGERPIFILPKIFIKDNKLFNKYPYELFCETSSDNILSSTENNTISNLIIKFYQSLKKFNKEYNVSIEDGNILMSNVNGNEISELDVMLSLIKIHKRNPSIFVQRSSLKKSNQINKVNWGKIFSRNQSFIFENNLYINGFCNKNTVNTSEDILLLLFYNLLNEFKYIDPTINLPESVKILSKNEFQKLKSNAIRLLKRIKSNYFRDTLKHIWMLLYSYFELQQIKSGQDKIKYLLISNYQLVFEKMVDYLISDEALLKKYKILKDNKEVDHLFSETDIFLRNQIIYIGDSKYYKDIGNIRRTRFKQFTYAKNIIQENIYKILNNDNDDMFYMNYRDPFTEGYNITPNFFIIGNVSDNYKSMQGKVVELDNSYFEETCHFENRVFDRDSLDILYFHIDFIYLLESYIKSNYREIIKSKDDIRQVISSYVKEYFDSKYNFYLISNSIENREFFERNFKKFIGKIFISPIKREYIILALDNKYIDENNKLLSYLEEDVQYDMVTLEEIGELW